MRILFVCSGNEISTESNLALNQADSLISHKVDVDVFYIKGKGIIGYLSNILPLKTRIRKNHYDLIHAHYGLSGCIAMLAKNSKTKLVISFMGNDILGDHANNGNSTYFGNLLVRISKILARYSDYIIVKSDEISQKIKNNNKSIIPNGVNLKSFYTLDRQEALNRIGWDPVLKHFLFMSNPDRPEKNSSLIYSALKLTEVKSVQLHFLNRIPYNELVYYYNASDVCILMSYHEGSPNVIKEAMSCDRPIVCTDVGDVRWVIGNTEGCYFCSYDPADVAEKLKFALNFAETKGRTNGRERIIELGLDSETIARKLVGVYNKVLNS